MKIKLTLEYIAEGTKGDLKWLTEAVKEGDDQALHEFFEIGWVIPTFAKVEEVKE